MTQTTDKSGKPITLRENEITPNLPAAQPAAANTTTIILVVLVAVVFLIAGLIIATMMGGSDEGITEEELNDAVAKAVGTQVALVQPVSSGSGGVSQQDVQQIIDDAVATQVQALIPTNTPIPPTPTIIPNDVAFDGDPYLGKADAPIVIVEFSDFQCGFCGRFAEETLPQIMEAYPDQVKFVYRDYTIFGEESVNAAIAAQCANDQDKFLEMHDLIFANHSAESPLPLTQETFVSFADDIGLDTATFETCMASDEYRQEVMDDFAAAQAFGFQGTPGFIINGVVYTFGAQPFETFQRIIDAELQEAS